MLKKLRCIYLHRNYMFGLPSAGKFLTFDCECIECGYKFQIVRPNTPQWITPNRRDITQPETWAEWEKLHPVTPLGKYKY